MQEVQRGQNSFHVFDFTNQISVRKGIKKTVQTGRKRLFVSIITAFFIVVLASLTLNFINSKFEGQVVLGLGDQKAAFQPGQFVTETLKNGYMGEYR